MKHIYTHMDKDGMLWRFEGGRPISKLADEVMAAVKKKLRHYVLKDGVVRECPDLFTWAAQFETAERTVGKDEIGEALVSTVFLGLDHNFSGKGPPVLWECMVFGGPLDKETERCAGSLEQALAMHAEMVKRVKEANDHNQQNPD